MNKKICCFALEILNLISCNKKESLTVIEEKLSEHKLAEYIVNNYGTEFSCDYDCDEINFMFEKYSGYFDGIENRKFGLKNQDDGLLFILALILEYLKN